VDCLEQRTNPRLLRDRIAQLDQGATLRVPAGERVDVQLVTAALAGLQIGQQGAEVFDLGF
jgi:hypothetical protein